MPRTRVRKAHEPSIPAAVGRVVVRLAPPYRVRPPGKGQRARRFENPFKAFRYAEELAAKLGTKTWIEGLPSPTGDARAPFHREPAVDDDE